MIEREREGHVAVRFGDRDLAWKTDRHWHVVVNGKQAGHLVTEACAGRGDGWIIVEDPTSVNETIKLFITGEVAVYMCSGDSAECSESKENLWSLDDLFK